MAKLVGAPDLDSGGETRAGSNPVIRIYACSSADKSIGLLIQVSGVRIPSGILSADESNKSNGPRRRVSGIMHPVGRANKYSKTSAITYEDL